MKVGARLGVTAIGSLLISAVLGLGLAHVSSAVAVADFRDLSPELRAHVHAEEMTDAMNVSLRLAMVLVPLTMGIVWWRAKRTAPPKATP